MSNISENAELRFGVVDPAEERGHEMVPAAPLNESQMPISEFQVPRFTLDEVNSRDMESLNVLAEKCSLHFESPTPYTSFRIQQVGVHSMSGTCEERFYKKLMKEGSDSRLPVKGELVYIYYTGYYCSGTEFKPFSPLRKGQLVVLGSEHIMVGVDHAIATMTRGEAALFVIPPTMTNGPAQKEYDIIPMMKLFFEIEVLDLGVVDVSPEKDGSILKKIIKSGDGLLLINDGAEVKVRIAKYEKRQFLGTMEHDYTFGEYMYFNVPKAVDLALPGMKLLEKCILYASTKYGPAVQDPDLSPEFDPPLEYRVTLQQVRRAPEACEMLGDQKFLLSMKLLEKGDTFFQDGNITLALTQFKKIVSFLEDEPDVSVWTREVQENCLITAYINGARCYLQLSNATDAKRCCDKVLRIQPENEKALFRRGQAFQMLKEYNLAYDDFNKIRQSGLDSEESATLAAECRKLAEDQMQSKESTDVDDDEYDEDETERRAANEEQGLEESTTEATQATEAMKLLKLVPIDEHENAKNNNSSE